MKLESTAHQPKMLRRIQMRYALGLFAVAALLFAWYALKDFVTDPGEGGHTDTSGWLVALKETPEGHQVAVIKPDGTVLDCPGYTNGASDQDPTFNHDGERIFFVSDRGSGKSLQVYRWNPARARVDQRSSGKLACEHPTFLEDGAPVGAETMLLAKAGVVVEFNPKDGTAHQLVPPVGKSPTQAGGEDKEGMGAQFGPEYQHLGASFREAHWCKQGKYIAGVMRGDEGETLVIICVRDQKPDSKTVEDGMPHGIAKGEHIDMAIDPASGKIVYSVNNFQFIDPEA
ncbi:MAG TPA: hypothetical protein VKT78_07410, partial [Fimbriimonadaceae bacterium]|nr:hypothetical protein [Fimbriimonadaceae bacterium]